MALSQDDMAQIMDALSQTPQFQFLDQMRREKESASAQPADKMAMAGGDGDEDDLPLNPPDGAGDGGDDDLEALLAQAGGDAGGNAAPPADDDPDKYRGRNCYSQQGQPERYQAAFNKLLRDHTSLRKEVVALRRERADAVRSERLRRLCSDFPGVDYDDEAKVSLYSMGSEMSDAQFAGHVATVERYAQQFAGATRMLPGGADMGRTPIGVAGISADAKYEARLSEMAVTIATRAADKGAPISWGEAEQQARQAIGAN